MIYEYVIVIRDTRAHDIHEFTYIPVHVYILHTFHVLG